MEQRRRIRARWVYRGFGLGILAAFALTGIELAWVGWGILPVQLVFNLLWCPCIAAMVAYGRCPVPRERTRPWRLPKLRIRTLMALVAYVALLFGVGVSTQRLGWDARVYGGKAITYRDMAVRFREYRTKSEAEARLRLENAAELRAGKVPEGILPAQKEFLRSLETTATPEYRVYRYGLIEQTEQWIGTMAERNTVVYRGLVEHHEKLADKYNRARRRPWRPVEPDPPMPPTK